jgi:hypothetical protein
MFTNSFKNDHQCQRQRTADKELCWFELKKFRQTKSKYIHHPLLECERCAVVNHRSSKPLSFSWGLHWIHPRDLLKVEDPSGYYEIKNVLF